jgi:hypothetical protein
MENTTEKKIDVERIKEMVDTTPNDMELGEKIRFYFYELEETR